MSFQNTTIGILSGALAGIAVGLLIAPAKGSETRQKISETADELRRKIRSVRGQVSMELEDLQDIFSSEINGLKDDVRETILKLIEASRESYKNVKDEALYN